MTDSLSPRERLILELAAKGHTDKGIAAEIGIAPSTVLTYWLRIRSKLGPHPRAELVAAFVRTNAEIGVAQLKAELDQLLAKSEQLDRELSVFKQFIESAPEAMLIIGDDGIIQLGNAQAAEMLEVPEETLVGTPAERFVPEELRAIHQIHHMNYIREPQRLQMGHAGGVPMITGRGRRIHGIAMLNHAKTASGSAVILIMRPLQDEPLWDRGEPIAERD
jgi:PAS domain S-box-containing protein